MGKWNHSINIKQYLADEVTLDSVKAACKGTLEELNKLPHKGDFYLDSIKEQIQFILEDVESDGAAYGEWTDADDYADAFNDVLNDLYDWADHHRVWMGL